MLLYLRSHLRQSRRVCWLASWLARIGQQLRKVTAAYGSIAGQLVSDSEGWPEKLGGERDTETAPSNITTSELACLR